MSRIDFWSRLLGGSFWFPRKWRGRQAKVASRDSWDQKRKIQTSWEYSKAWKQPASFLFQVGSTLLEDKKLGQKRGSREGKANHGTSQVMRRLLLTWTVSPSSTCGNPTHLFKAQLKSFHLCEVFHLCPQWSISLILSLYFYGGTYGGVLLTRPSLSTDHKLISGLGPYFLAWNIYVWNLLLTLNLERKHQWSIYPLIWTVSLPL